MQYNGITDDNVETKDMLIVSINNVKDTSSYFEKEHENVKIMHFGDYSEEMITLLNYSKEKEKENGVFNNEMAKELYEFIKRNKDKNLAVLHCAAGISRSAGVGTFIQDLYGTQSFQDFKRKNPQIQPNLHVLNLLRKMYEKDMDE